MDSLAKTAKVEFKSEEILAPWEATHCSLAPAASWDGIYWAQEVQRRRIRGRRLEELHLPGGGILHKSLIFRQMGCAGTTVAALLTPEQLDKYWIYLLNQDHRAGAVCSHLLPPPQSHHPAFIPANLHLSHRLLFFLKIKLRAGSKAQQDEVSQPLWCVQRAAVLSPLQRKQRTGGRETGPGGRGGSPVRYTSLDSPGPVLNSVCSGSSPADLVQSNAESSLIPAGTQTPC